jgi:hypothetical protein
MARTGVFGRQPRVSQSLNSTLVAIARQFQQQRDQNLMDAWQKGGAFEGKKATDALVLAHWKERLNGISPDDPLHDTYANAVTQIDYSIHESKMTALYALGKTSDGQMVNFYLGWAKKVPKDSEFFRVLQRDAGQYMRSAKANSASLAKQHAEDLYQSQQNDTRKGMEAAGEYIIDTLRRVAQSGYAPNGIAAPIAAPGSGSDLTDFDPSDPATMLRLLQVIEPHSAGSDRNPEAPAGHFSGNADVIYHDDDKKPVTGKDIIATLQKLDPSWQPGQPLDVAHVTDLLDRQVQGLDQRIARANATGHLTDATNLSKSKEYVALLNRQVAAWPVEKAYSDLRATFDAVANDPTASPAAVLRAWQSYQGQLTSLANDPRIAADDNLRSRLIGEANGDSSQPTLAESFTGLQGGEFSGQAKDSKNTADHMQYLLDQQDAVATGAAYWTYGKTNSQGVFVPQAGGTEIGAASTDAIDAGGQNKQQITVPDPRGGVPITMFVTAVPVYATAKDPTTGEPLSPTSGQPIGYAYDIAKGGKTVTMYGFQTNGQGFVFSEDPPWDSSLKSTASSNGGNHIEVDFTPIVAQSVYGGINPDTGQPTGAVDMNQNNEFGAGLGIRGAKANQNGPVTPGKLVFDPTALATSTSDRNATGSADPSTDFQSLTLANLMSDREGLTILSNLDKNPAIKLQLDNDAHAYAGDQFDYASGQYIPGTGDQNKYNAAQQQIGMASAGNEIVGAVGGVVNRAIQLWQRDTTGSPFPNGSTIVPNNAGGSTVMPPTNQKLASDSVIGTAFHALGSIFKSGTNQINPPTEADNKQFQIKSGITMTVPGYTPPMVNPINLSTGSVAIPNNQGGSTAPTSAQGGTTRPTTVSGGSRPKLL